MKLNNIILLLILLEIIIIIIEYNTTIIRKLKLIDIIGKYQPFKLLVLLFFIIVFIVNYVVCSYFKINIGVGCIFLFLGLILILNYRLHKNKKLTTRTISFEDSLENTNTGDLIIWETGYELPTIFNLIPVIMTGLFHIGIILKEDNGIINLLECSNVESYCTYTNRTKTGIMLVDYLDRIKSTQGSYFLVKTNLKNYITNNNIKEFFEKHKNKNYMEDNFNCITTYLHFLEDNNLLKKKYKLFPFYYEEMDTLLDPQFYSVDFKTEIYKVKNE